MRAAHQPPPSSAAAGYRPLGARGKDLIARTGLVGVSGNALALAGCSLGDEESPPPRLGAKSSDSEASAKLGFPSTATRNTIRVGGADAAADAAGVASALFPAADGGERPTAVVLVDKDDWQGAVSAGVLAGRPIGAPMLLTDGGDVPPVTQDTIDRLASKGSDLEGRPGHPHRPRRGRPSGVRSAVIEGDDAYERAAAIDRFFSAARASPRRTW